MRFQREITAAVLIPAVLAVLVARRLGMGRSSSRRRRRVALLEFYRLIEAAGWIVPRNRGHWPLRALLVAAHLASLRAARRAHGRDAASPADARHVRVAGGSGAPRVFRVGAVFATLYVALGGADRWA